MKPTLMVLAAGMGSRYGGVKQIDSVGLHGETLLDFGVYDAMQSGFGKVVFVIRRDIERDFRERLFDRIARNMDASYVFQDRTMVLDDAQQALSVNRTKPWGTIHAVLCAEQVIDAPFTVINADDYYGRKAFMTIAGHLSTQPVDGTEHAMVGYILRNTTSKSGTVSRAVCSVRDDYLVSMKENTKIGYEADGSLVSHLDEGDKVLTGEEWVSMNFFGFTPRAFEDFHGFFDRFLAKQISSPKAECYLPEGASDIVTSKAGRIRFYTTDEQWFGMTYHEDRESVKRELAAKIAKGYYPEQLWAY